MKRSIAGSLMLAALFLTAADCRGRGSQDPSLRPSPNCSWTNAGDRHCEYPMQKGVQPAPSITQTQ